MDHIEQLHKEIENLQIDCDKKDALIASVNGIKNEFTQILDNLKAKSEEYDKLLGDLKQMRQVINQTYFKGKWKIIKFLLK